MTSSNPSAVRQAGFPFAGLFVQITPGDGKKARLKLTGLRASAVGRWSLQAKPPDHR